MERPDTRYAKSGDVGIAYQVVGEGPFDLVLVPGFISNVELAWEEPGVVSFYERLASFCRLIVFDKRGTGLSDRVAGVATLETRMDDARAVMDAGGSERAALIGYSEGASLAALFATTYPERFPTRHESVRRVLEEIGQRWGTPDYCDELLENDAPSKLDRRGVQTLVRSSASTQRRPGGGRGTPADNVIPPATASSTAPGVRSAPPSQSPTRSRTSVSRSAPDCTRANASSSTARPQGSRSTSARASPRWPGPTTSSSHARSRISSPARESSFEDRGAHELEGVPGEWEFFAVKR